MFVCLSWCLVCVYDLAQVADAEAKGSGVTWAGVHVVANEQDDLKELGKVIALDQLLARCSHGHDVRLHVIYLLFKLQPEQDGVEPRLQTFHRTYLQHRDRQTDRQRRRKSVRLQLVTGPTHVHFLLQIFAGTIPFSNIFFFFFSYFKLNSEKVQTQEPV